MEYDEFISAVQTLTGTNRRDAEAAVRAALSTLADRVAPGAARELAMALPPEVLGWLHTETEAEPFDLHHFVQRIADREGGIDLDIAERHARAVFAVVRRAVPPDVLERLEAELPRDVRSLVDLVAVPPVDALVERVAAGAHLVPDAARQLLDAVLETVAERIAPGEVDDLLARLPIELHPPLRTGQAHADESTRQMDVADFIRRVETRSALPPSDLIARIRVVFDALRDVLGVEQFSHVAVQLPREFDAVIPHR
jgi:uncharacterized protein (DUF2267 family)